MAFTGESFSNKTSPELLTKVRGIENDADENGTPGPGLGPVEILSLDRAENGIVGHFQEFVQRYFGGGSASSFCFRHFFLLYGDVLERH